MGEVVEMGGLNFDFLQSLIVAHNSRSMGVSTDTDFLEFINQNKMEASKPVYLQIYSEVLDIEEKYFEENKELCDFVYAIMQNNPDWSTTVAFGLRDAVRIGVFEDKYKKFLAQ